jgi:hypothetical protein
VIPASLESATVGTRIWFLGESRPYRVRARSERYMVCTKPFNPKHTVLYTVVDLVEGVRGTENLIFGMGAETDQDCEEMIQRLEGKCEGVDPTEVSHRNRVALCVIRIAS